MKLVIGGGVKTVETALFLDKVIKLLLTMMLLLWVVIILLLLLLGLAIAVDDDEDHDAGVFVVVNFVIVDDDAVGDVID